MSNFVICSGCGRRFEFQEGELAPAKIGCGCGHWTETGALDELSEDGRIKK